MSDQNSDVLMFDARGGARAMPDTISPPPWGGLSREKVQRPLGRGTFLHFRNPRGSNSVDCSEGSSRVVRILYVLVRWCSCWWMTGLQDSLCDRMSVNAVWQVASPAAHQHYTGCGVRRSVGCKKVIMLEARRKRTTPSARHCSAQRWGVAESAPRSLRPRMHH